MNISTDIWVTGWHTVELEEKVDLGGRSIIMPVVPI